MISRLLGWLAAALAFGVLTWAILGLPAISPGLAREAQHSLAESGVSNPVTAVLLNYRAYDTLLELGVLLLATMAVWSIRAVPAAALAGPAGPILGTLLRVLLPLLVTTGGYVLWIGAFAPGGAFQGGALLGGALVLILLGGLIPPRRYGESWWLRAGLVAGVAVFVLVALGVMPLAGRLLQYRDARAKNLILLIESAALLSIGLTLGALFLGGRPEREEEPPTSRDR